MEKGQIVRRVLNDGTPVGPYLLVRGFVNNNHVLTQRCEVGITVKNTDSLYYAKKKLTVCKMTKLVISDPIWNRIEEGRQIAIIHDATPAWQKMQDSEPELVQLRSIKYPKKVIVCVVDGISDCFYNRSRQIRLVLNNRIL